MNWGKLFAHDLRCGLRRWRYAAAIPLFVLPCLLGRMEMAVAENTDATYLDYLLFCLRGVKSASYVLEGNENIRLPILWLMVMGGCLFLNLDYLLGDLTLSGQQVIVRSGNRRSWYLSKCLWNLCATALYLTIGYVTVLLFTLLVGDKATWESTAELAPFVFREVVFAPLGLTAGQGALLTLLLPLITLAALSMLEMTLCLLVRPVISFLICMLLLVVAVFWDSPLALGIGAMTYRSEWIMPGGIHAGPAALVALVAIAACIIVGCRCFQYTDLIGLEE